MKGHGQVSIIDESVCVADQSIEDCFSENENGDMIKPIVDKRNFNNCELLKDLKFIFRAGVDFSTKIKPGKVKIGVKVYESSNPYYGQAPSSQPEPVLNVAWTFDYVDDQKMRDWKR
jgi:hypothetical protein